MGCESNGDKESAVAKCWYVGVILSIFGSIATNMGVNMQKYSFMSEAKRCIKLKRGYFRQPLWVFGLALVIDGSRLDFVPQSLATPVGGSTMVANVIFVSLFLKEKFSCMDALGTALVLIGICIVAVFAEKESGCYTVNELASLYSEPLFIMYIIVMGFSCIGLYLLTKKMEQLLRVYGSSSLRYKRYVRVSPIFHFTRNWDSLSTLLHNTLISLSFCLGGLAAPALLSGALGVFGAQSILFAKSVTELVKTSAKGTNQFVSLGTYAISLSMFACIFLQIHWLAHGLQSFDTVFVVPVSQCFFTSVSIFGGGIYFKEFSKMSILAARLLLFYLLFAANQPFLTSKSDKITSSSLSWQLGMVFFGASVTLSGVYLLSKRDMNVLRPLGKFRAAVKMIIFIKRAQKTRNIEHRWVVPLLSKCSPEPSPTVKCVKAPTLAPKATSLRISKASVMPAAGRQSPPLVVAVTTTDNNSCGKIEIECSVRENEGDGTNLKTALDSSSSQLELTSTRSEDIK